MPKIKNGGFDQHGAGTFEQQRFGTAGVEGIKVSTRLHLFPRRKWKKKDYRKKRASLVTRQTQLHAQL